MSQSPETPESLDDRNSYLSAFGELAQRIRDGASFSGRERHCAFLNNTDGTFADISSVSGFDLPHDGRGMALTDWDHDGDLDVWMLNRTAPRVQFLQNRIPTSDSRWISFHLQGDPNLGTPRDAIGSRIELLLTESSSRRVKTLHAGQGLMSQSSKWLHFGLAPDEEVSGVRVRWAGGGEETYSELSPGQRWRLLQGSAQATPDQPRKLPGIDPGALELPAPTEVARIRLSQPLKTPDLVYRQFDGQNRSISELSNRGAVLVNLWATWCAPCVAELESFAAAGAQLRAANLQVLALNVDHLGPGSDITPQRAATFLDQHGPGLAGGMASPELVDVLNQSILKSVYRHRDMPVPVSFLIDQGGWLSAIYKGPVEIDQVLTDRRDLGKSPEQALAAAVPFPGRWAKPQFISNPMTIAAAHMEGGYLDDARTVLQDYLTENAAPPGDDANPAQQQNNRQLGGVHYQLAEISRLEQDPIKAREHYEESLAYNPRQIPALNNLAWLLASSSNPQVRDGEQAVKRAEFMMRAPGSSSNPTLLGTLAASYAAAGRFSDAVTLTKRIIAMLEEQGRPDQAQTHRQRLERFQREEALAE